MKILTSRLADALIWTVLSVEFTWLAVMRGGWYWLYAVVAFACAARCWNAYWLDRRSDS